MARVVAGVACALLLVQAAPAWADDRTYDELIQTAVREFGLAHWEESRALFRQAHALYPNARTLRGLAMASFELRDYVDSVHLLRAALVNDAEPLTDELRRHAEGLLEQALTYVGRYQVKLTPPDARLTLDGREAELDAQGMLLVPIGTVELEATREGYAPIQRKLRVTGGEEAELELVLEPASADEVSALEPGEQPLETKPSDAGDDQRIVAYVVGAVGVAAVGVGAVFGLQALSKDSDSSEHCDGNRCDDRGTELRNDARTAGDIATVGWGLGLAGLAAGAILYFTAADAGDGDVEGPPSVALRLGPDAAGLLLQGRW